MRTSDFKSLIVWQKAMDLAESVYTLTKSLPTYERFVFSDQIRRAAISIPSNIAEGQGRDSQKEFVKFLSIARGSLCELETQLILGKRIGYLNETTANNFYAQIADVGRLLKALSTSISRQLNNSTTKQLNNSTT